MLSPQPITERERQAPRDLALAQAIELYREGYLSLKEAMGLAQKHGVSRITIWEKFQEYHRQ